MSDYMEELLSEKDALESENKRLEADCRAHTRNHRVPGHTHAEPCCTQEAAGFHCGYDAPLAAGAADDHDVALMRAYEDGKAFGRREARLECAGKITDLEGRQLTLVSVLQATTMELNRMAPADDAGIPPQQHGADSVESGRPPVFSGAGAMCTAIGCTDPAVGGGERAGVFFRPLCQTHLDEMSEAMSQIPHNLHEQLEPEA